MAVPVRWAIGPAAVDTGTPVALFATRLASGAAIGSRGFVGTAQYAVAADGRFLMNVEAGQLVTTPISVVLNWQSALTR